jgi:hypothetical protein
MDFTTTERIEAPRDLVLAALADHDYYAFLATRVSTIEAPELLEAELEGDRLRLQVRYAFAGELSGAAKMAIDASKLTWVIHTELDRSTHRATLDIVPDHYGDLVVCDGAANFAEDGAATLEIIEGSLEVKIPFIAGAAERAIVDGLLRHLAAEAAALSEFCASRA